MTAPSLLTARHIASAARSPPTPNTQVVQDELGAPWYEIFAELTPEPIAAASLGQVYKGRLKTGEQVGRAGGLARRDEVVNA